MIRLLTLLGCLLLVVDPADGQAARPVNLPPVSAFASLPEMAAPSLSPDGRKLLFLSPLEDTYHAAVLDLEKKSTALVLAADPDQFLINWCRWANNDRIICSIRFYDELEAGQLGVGRRYYRDGRTTFTRMIAVDTDGGNRLQLVDPPSNRGEISDAQWNAVDQDNILSMLPDDRRHILIQLNREDRMRPSVYRLNIYNNRLNRVRSYYETVLSWYADDDGELRFAIGFKDTDPAAYSVDAKKRIHELDLSSIAASVAPSFCCLSPDGEYVYFASYHDGGTRKLFGVPASGEGDPITLLDIEDYDFSGSLFWHPSRGNLLLAQYFTETTRQHWFDEAFEQRLAGAFQTLQSEHDNVTLLSMDDSVNRFVFAGEGRSSAPTYYLYDHASGALNRLASTYRNIPEVVESAIVTYQTRDDYPIVAYLTRPAGEGPFPAVILPHGGPNSRDRGGFDYWAQFLVSRGYAVLQPNFRGSTGYGLDHLSQGFEQWGLRMQDDVVDGLDWMIEEGIADPQRVCFVGGSYGGYVALTAAFKMPERIRCAVSFAGVTDLGHLKKHVSQYDLGELTLARIQDGAAVYQNSPMRQIEQMDVPLLIVHGDLDRSVMIEQSRNLVAGLEKAGKPHRYVEQSGGDHFLSRESQRIEFFQELDAFLAQYLRQGFGKDPQ